MTTIVRLHAACFQAFNEGDELIGQAVLNPDHTWIVSKTQWRGANGRGKIGGFLGGPMEIGTIPANVSLALGVKLVKAMLGVLR